MSDLYFVYDGADGYQFIAFIQTLELFPNGDLKIYFGKEYKIFVPKENDVYRCGESHRWTILESGNRWFSQ